MKDVCKPAIILLLVMIFLTIFLIWNFLNDDQSVSYLVSQLKILEQDVKKLKLESERIKLIENQLSTLLRKIEDIKTMPIISDANNLNNFLAQDLENENDNQKPSTIFVVSVSVFLSLMTSFSVLFIQRKKLMSVLSVKENNSTQIKNITPPKNNDEDMLGDLKRLKKDKDDFYYNDKSYRNLREEEFVKKYDKDDFEYDYDRYQEQRSRRSLYKEQYDDYEDRRFAKKDEELSRDRKKQREDVVDLKTRRLSTVFSKKTRINNDYDAEDDVIENKPKRSKSKRKH